MFKLAIKDFPHKLILFRKILIFASFVLLLIITIEGLYYFLVFRNKAKESKYVNTNIAYQEGVYLFSKENGELISIIGKVTQINGLFLKVENQGEEVLVEMDKNFEYLNISEEPKESPKSLGEIEEEIKGSENAEEDLRKRLTEERVILIPEIPNINDLNKLIEIGDFVVVSRLETGGGTIKSGLLSVLGFMRK